MTRTLGRLRSRGGFTLIEMVVAMTLMLVVLGLSTQLFRRQATLVSSQSGRSDAQQNARFGMLSLERELRVAGVGVVTTQPMLVQAGAMAITFNANIISRIPNDIGSVYIDPDADSMSVGVLRSGMAVYLPISGARYPDSTYMAAAGVESEAQTISYWLSRDSMSTNANEYILFRRANAATPRVVARGILVNAADTVFQYFKADTAGNLTAVPVSSLPLIHTRAVHGLVADTGRYALIDSVRTVRARFKSVYHDPNTGDATRTVQMTIHIMNAGLDHHTTCGQAPLSVSPTATLSPPAAPSPFITITWAKSGDDGAGEKDVERYAIFRRPAAGAFNEPFASIPGGSASYSIVDNNVKSGDSWVYGVSAEDCTPTQSPIGSTLAVTVP